MSGDSTVLDFSRVISSLIIDFVMQWMCTDDETDNIWWNADQDFIVMKQTSLLRDKLTPKNPRSQDNKMLEVTSARVRSNNPLLPSQSLLA